jgi:hypothetical protein
LAQTVPQGPGRVAILIATYNGATFLSQQLDTSDDGSDDGTADILRVAAAEWTKGRFEIVDGPGKGLVENFRSLLRREEIDADFVAFSDQDDIWRLDKLAKAIDWLNSQDPAKPALYCGRVELIGEHEEPLGFSPVFRKSPGLRNALVQSIAGGNTMVMNRAAHRLLREASKRTPFVIHDWWTYLLVAAAGGRIYYSPKPDVLYRQHSANVIGANTSWASRFRRIEPLLAGRFASWTDQNLGALTACRDLLSSDGRAIIDEFSQMRRQPLVSRVRTLRSLGLYRQTWLGQISLYAACLLNRL